MEECMICFEETTRFKFFPCQHKVCMVCFPKLTRCPLCQVVVVTVQPERKKTEYCKIFTLVVSCGFFCFWIFHIARWG